jgi:uncharacterized protein (TIGR04141 family)
MSNKIQTSIYKIDDERISFDELAEAVLKQNYKAQALKLAEKDGYKLKLFYLMKKTSPDWKDFYKNIVVDRQQILRKLVNNEGYVLLLKSESDSVYALTGGLGFFAIQDFIDPEFGLNVMAKIIKKDEKVLKSVKENSVLGGVQGSILFFRKDYNLLENEGFGKIYQELKAFVDKKILTEKFGFSPDTLKNSPVCLAKSSFRLNKKISFQEILSIITGCEGILDSDDPSIQINSVTKINKKRKPELVEALKKGLEDLIWQKFKGDSLDEKFDLCHREFEKYLTASKFKVFKGASKTPALEFQEEPLTSLDLLLQKILETNQFAVEDKGCKTDFIEYLDKLYIRTFDHSTYPSTKGKFFNHLFAEIEYKNKKYFFINGVWYLISEDFLENLNDSCRNFLNSHKVKSNLIDKAWDYASGDSENIFNKTFIGDEKTLVLDKITPENIEPCDILKWDDDNVYLVHVKAGFDGSMRDLSSQVIIAASTIYQDIKSGKNYLKKVYRGLLAKKESSDRYFNLAGIQTDSITEQKFCDLFKKKLVFVLGVLDTAGGQRQIENVETFNSNIAKFSTVELFKQMKGIGVELQFCQIKKRNS